MAGNARTFILMAAMTALLMMIGALIGGRGGMLLALLVTGGINLWAWWNSDQMVLRQHGAMEVTPANGADLLALVRGLAGNAGLPMPKVYILPSEQPNAFATGRNPQHAAVAVTQGILRVLSRDELAGVIAHELAHVRHRDTLTMTVTATLAGAISMLANIAFFTGGGRGRGGAGTGLLLMIFAPMAAGLVQMAISRTREYEADREGARISGKPLALASALSRIATEAGRQINAPAERNPASAALFIINPLHGNRLKHLFTTHPPTEERIARLQAMAGQIGDMDDSAGPSIVPRVGRRAQSW